jgi:hypothetical protein
MKTLSGIFQITSYFVVGDISVVSDFGVTGER